MKEARGILRIIHDLQQAVEPTTYKTRLKATDNGSSDDQYQNFSDLSLIARPLEGVECPPLGAQLSDLLLHLVRAQARLIVDESILIRGTVTMGRVVKSRGELFGPAVVRAYELERDRAEYPRIIIDDRILQGAHGFAGCLVARRAHGQALPTAPQSKRH